MGALYADGHLVFGGAALQGLPALGYGLAWLLDFIMVGITEEALYRGYLQATLTRGIGFWPAVFLDTRGLPKPATGEQARYILERLAESSRPFGTLVEVKGETAEINLKTEK